MKQKSTVILFLGGILIILLFVLAGISIFYFNFSLSKQRIANQNIYRLTEINPLKNKTSYGTVKMLNPLEKDYISYFSEDGSFFIISPFMSNEFECRATCMCTEEEDMSRDGLSLSRRSAIAISKSLFFLVSAVSSIIAISIAKDYIVEECQKLLQYCESNKIIPNVDDCETKATEFEEFVEDKMKKSREFRCRGFCMYNRKLTDKEAKIQAILRECFLLSIAKEIVIQTHSSFSPEHELTLARSFFEKEYLFYYCKKAGHFEYTDETTGKLKKFKLCHEHDDIREKQSNIFCIADFKVTGNARDEDTDRYTGWDNI